MTQHLSKHRHISFTAHYTGYIWYQMGISHEALATSKGKSLAYLVHPLESWAEKYGRQHARRLNSAIPCLIMI